MKASRGVLLLLISISVWACSSDAKVSDEKVNNPNIGKTEATEVKVVTADKKDFQYLIQTNGLIEAREDAKIQFQTNGLLKEVFVTNGQEVEHGQVLAKLDNAQELLAIKQAETQLEKAKIEYRSLLLSFNLENKSQEVRQQIEITQRHGSGLSAAEIALDEARLALSYTKLKAPISGKVSGLELKAGNMISGTVAFCRLYSDHDLLVKVKVLETDIGRLRLGLKAEVYPLSKDRGFYNAQLEEIDPQVDENGMLSVRLKLEQTNGLLPGMNAKVIIRIPYNRNVIVPKEAIVIRSGRNVVFTFEEGLAKWNYVETGMENGKEVEVLEGLASSSQVIVSNNLQLAHDSPVALVNNEE